MCVDAVVCSTWLAPCYLNPCSYEGAIYASVIMGKGIHCLMLLESFVAESAWVGIENEVPELQCGFRVGRGSPDAAFCARQVIEKAYEHHCKLFIIFIDLCKAYDLVPRAGLWNAFHEDMVATVRVAGGCSEPIQVCNGLRQGCVMARVLFNLYFAVVLERFHELLSRLPPES